jgi:hypothetical protein
MSGEAVPDRAAPSGEPSAEHEVERIAAELVGVLGAGWSWPSIVDRFPVGHPAREHWLKAARTLHARGLRATPAEPGASPPEALVEKWAALATSGDGRHPEAAETLSRCASELKGALAARSPVPAGDAPTGLRYDVIRDIGSRVVPGDAPREDALRWALAAVEAEPELPGDMPREMAAALATLTTEEEWSEVLRATVRATKDSIANRLRGAVSPSPWPCECGEVADHAAGCPSGTRAASEGEA